LSIAALSDRSVVRIAGADARGYLQDMLTNDVATLAPGKPLWAGLLSAQGKPLFDMILHDDGPAVLLDVASTLAAALVRRLTMYRLRRAVTIEPTAQAVFAAWDEPGDHPADPRLAQLGLRWIGGGVPTASAADYHARRLVFGVPDTDDLLLDRMLWLEANAVELNGVSFTKGCYVGQENTARMHHRDKLRRRLLPVRFDGVAGVGDPVMAGATVAGELRTSIAGRGIAYLKLELTDGPLTLNGAPLVAETPDWLR